jgi:membrane protein implicated in regulation of membrane protease activity
VTPEAFSLVTTGLGSVIALLLGLLVWFLRREIKQNDEAHKNLGQRIDRVEGKIDRLSEDVAVLREDAGVLKGILIRHYGSPEHGR